jgi:hypothetical protein
MRLALVLILIVLGGDAAWARPTTFVCVFVEKTGDFFFNRFGEVDRIVVDFDAPSLDFRSEASMKTAEPLNWSYQNRPAALGNPADKIVMTEHDGVIRAAGTRFGWVFGFVASASSATLLSMDPRGVIETVRFRCAR